MIVIQLNEKNHAITARPEQDDYVLKANELDASIVDDPNVFPFYKKKWNGTGWEEGATQEEIERIHSQSPVMDRTDQIRKRVEEAENAILMLMDMSL